MLRLYAAIALVIAAVAAFAWIRHNGAVSEREKQLRFSVAEYQRKTNEAQAIAKALEAQLELLRQDYEATKKELADEINKPVYRDCRVPANGLRILRKAVEGKPAR